MTLCSDLQVLSKPCEEYIVEQTSLDQCIPPNFDNSDYMDENYLKRESSSNNFEKSAPDSLIVMNQVWVHRDHVITTHSCQIVHAQIILSSNSDFQFYVKKCQNCVTLRNVHIEINAYIYALMFINFYCTVTNTGID